MLRSRLDQQNLLTLASESEEEKVLQQVYVLNVKSSDKIWFEFGVEFKQFNEAVSYYIQNSVMEPTFEQKMIEKEEEVMDESIWGQAQHLQGLGFYFIISLFACFALLAFNAAVNKT